MRRIGMAAAAALAPVTLLLTLSLSTACGGGAPLGFTHQIS